MYLRMLKRMLLETDKRLLFKLAWNMGLKGMLSVEKHKRRLMLLDYKDARKVGPGLLENIFDLGDGAIDFPACHRVLKSIAFKGWLCVDLDTARQGPRVSYERCGAYVIKTLEPIYV